MSYLHYAIMFWVVTFIQTGPTAITQHKINELAGRCFNAQYALSGLKGSKKPGETQDQFTVRVKGYLMALDDADKSLRPLKQMPALVNTAPQNEKTWKGIVTNISMLGHDVAGTHSAWAATAREGEKAKLGQKLLQALNTLQTILAGLRDAKP